MKGESPPGPPAYWLIAKNAYPEIEVLTLDCEGERVLPVFSHEEEAQMFLRLGAPGSGWRARETKTGELLSVLSKSCAGVKEVALDPLPEMVAERTVGFVSLLRERFIERITARRRPLRARGPDRRSSLCENQRGEEGLARRPADASTADRAAELAERRDRKHLRGRFLITPR